MEVEDTVPIYEYECGACGPFEARRPMAQAAEPMACAACGDLAPRVVSAAAVLRGARRTSAAREPRVVTRPTGDAPPSSSRPRAGRGRPWQISG